MISGANKLMSANATTKTLVMGLGKTGLSVVRYLHRQGLAFCVFDTRQSPAGLQVLQAEGITPEIYLQSFDPSLLSQVQEVILSPGLSLQEPLVQ